jgi:hypothetical protein
MSTKTQTANYDRGYEDAIEGRAPRSGDAWYVRGYAQGMLFNLESKQEAGR